MKTDKTIQHIALLLIFSALMGALYPLIKLSEQSFPPVTMTLIRTASAALFMAFVVGIVMKRSLTPLLSQWKAFAVLGLLFSTF